jgi:hypothetical protein
MPLCNPPKDFLKPQNSFPTWSALTAGFVSIKGGDIGQAFHHISGVIHHNDTARSRHASSSR